MQGLLANASTGQIVANSSTGAIVGTSNTSGCNCCNPVTCQCTVSSTTYNISGWNVTVSGAVSPFPAQVPSADLNGSFYVPSSGPGACGGSIRVDTGGSGGDGAYGFGLNILWYSTSSEVSMQVNGFGGGGNTEVFYFLGESTCIEPFTYSGGGVSVTVTPVVA